MNSAEYKTHSEGGGADVLGMFAGRLSSHLSHQLRTPLSAILLWKKILSESSAPDAETLREGLRSIEDAVHEQEALIDEFVSIARVLNAQVTLERQDIDFIAVLYDLVQELETTAKDQGRWLEVEPASANELRFSADEARLREILSCLVENALTKTPSGGSVVIAWHCTPDEIEIRVSDNGNPRSEDEFHLLFNRPAERGSSKRLGLDLLIARRLAELHQGTLTAENSATGQGTTFIVRLPLHP